MDITALIYKVLSGNASEIETKKLDDWIALKDANKSEFHDIKLLYECACREDDQVSNSNPDEDLKAIKHLIHIGTRRRRKYRLMAGILSIIVLLVSVQIIIHANRDEKKSIHLKFEEASLEYVINTLQDRYEVIIEVGKEMVNCKVTGTFYQDTVDDMVRSISKSLNLKYTITAPDKFRIEGTCNQ
jgi:ferric-dicitrate binding protein FerR (iron transport regulator)